MSKEVKFKAPKTKDAQAFIEALGLGDVKRILIVVPEYDEATYKCFRNLRNGDEQKVQVRTAPASVKAGVDAVKTKTQAFSTRDLLLATKIVMAKDALKRIEEVWA